jgi:hypothetical protein
MNAKDLMLPALRQHRHNFGSEEFIAAYDYDEASKIVERLIAENEALKAKIAAVSKPFTENDVLNAVDKRCNDADDWPINIRMYYRLGYKDAHKALLARIEGE